LDAEHSQKVPGAEQGGVPTPQVKLKERQKFFEEAFQQDMEQYLSTGYLQITERRANGIFYHSCCDNQSRRFFLMCSQLCCPPATLPC
ncbi:Dysbindin, partial [Goodea atripinnis]